MSVASAQDDDETDSPAAETVEDATEGNENREAAPRFDTADEIVVTGSRLRRDEFNSVSPIEVITAEEASFEGLVDTASIIQGASVAAGSVQLNNQFGGFVVEGGTGANTISLRGLGAQRTLVLLNGRRPGPSGTRGQVGAFDLNVIPDSIVQRAEILKDGASAVYGSDAVAGVVNVITVDSIDRPILSVQANVPTLEGGEQYSVDGAFGINSFDNGSIIVAGQWQLNEDLSTGDRDFTTCGEDLYYDRVTLERIDRENRSVQAGGRFDECSTGNLYFNTVLDLVTGERFIPSPDGVTSGPIAGYRPRDPGRYDDGDGEPAFYESVFNSERALLEDVINKTERTSLFATSDFDLDILGGVNWKVEALYTNRKTRSEGIRQFFPQVFDGAYANDPDFETPFAAALPVLIYPSNSEIEVDYYSFATDLSGDFGGAGFLSDWNWSGYATYSYSDGDYTNEDQIFADQSGDRRFDDDAPVFDYFSPDILAGFYPDNFYSTLGGDITGNTVYEQFVGNAFVSGDLFELPAGDVLLALGTEYRWFSIDDQPAQESQDGNLWGFSSAQVTAGSDEVVEVFAELEVPILRGVPGFEELTFTGAGRVFDYKSTGSDGVYEVGLNWQVIPEIRFRGSFGTSYRSPALFELFLGDQTAFLGQIQIDPCIDLENQTGVPNLVANCTSIGIPLDYQGGGSSATIISGGGEDILIPETSEATTFGVVLTPEFLPISLSVDYFEIEVLDQISQLGAGAIVTGCYNADPSNFPNNQFCALLNRGSDTDEFAITDVNNSFVNINTQETRGIDANLRYEQDFDFGTFGLNAAATFTLEDTVQLFDSAQDSGFDSVDLNGIIGDPAAVGNAQATFERGDVTYAWTSRFIGHTSNEDEFEDSDAANVTYFGRDAIRKNFTESVWYHSPSVTWNGESTRVTMGVQNVFDEKPPFVSQGITNRRGNVPIVSQYDYRGRTVFVTVSQQF